jgi:hypothetical protein
LSPRASDSRAARDDETGSLTVGLFPAMVGEPLRPKNRFRIWHFFWFGALPRGPAAIHRRLRDRRSSGWGGVPGCGTNAHWLERTMIAVRDRRMVEAPAMPSVGRARPL